MYGVCVYVVYMHVCMCGHVVCGVYGVCVCMWYVCVCVCMWWVCVCLYMCVSAHGGQKRVLDPWNCEPPDVDAKNQAVVLSADVPLQPQ